jgi:glycosyltransferase involved in cell wall biosynthesis
MGGTQNSRYTFTVFTPTFNRAQTLPRVYESLKGQTFTDFEWLVVDDGSTDGTRDLIKHWLSEAPFGVRYFYQPNRGKHVADNLSVREALGRFHATLDSDDWYVPNALETFLAVWETIDPAERERFVGVVGLCAAPSGAIIGSPFPTDPLDTTYSEAHSRHRVVGDKAGMGRVDVVRRFLHPVIPNERLIMESIQYQRIGRDYRIRCVNKILMVKDYQPGGLSARTREGLKQNPRTAKRFFRQKLDESSNLAQRARFHAQHTRYSLHAGAPLESLRETPSKPLWTLTLPLSILLWVRDHLMHRRG